MKHFITRFLQTMVFFYLCLSFPAVAAQSNQTSNLAKLVKTKQLLIVKANERIHQMRPAQMAKIRAYELEAAELMIKKEIDAVLSQYVAAEKETEQYDIGLEQETAAEHPEILGNPAPRVRFENFGDSCLEFQVKFWVKFDGSKRVASDLRFAILKKFRDHDVEIAFPQLDLHLKEIHKANGAITH